MTLGQIIDIASEAYSDGLIKEYYLVDDVNHGDGLAKFIAHELQETFDEHASDYEQVVEAIRVMRSAGKQVDAVLRAFFVKEGEIDG